MAGPMALNRVSAYGSIVGLDLPAASKNVEFKPFVLGRLDTDQVRVPPVEREGDGDAGGDFKYGANNFPVQNYYLREVGKDAEGRLTNKLVGTTLEQHQDAYVGACRM